MNEHVQASGLFNIPDRDLPIWVNVFKREGITSAEEIQKELTLIDDLLSLQKRGRKDRLIKRIEKNLYNHTKESNHTKK